LSTRLSRSVMYSILLKER